MLYCYSLFVSLGLMSITPVTRASTAVKPRIVKRHRYRLFEIRKCFSIFVMIILTCHKPSGYIFTTHSQATGIHYQHPLRLYMLTTITTPATIHKVTPQTYLMISVWPSLPSTCAQRRMLSPHF